MWQYNAYGEALAHHGILGQKWGVRRFQNADGSLTDAGRIRYAKDEARIDSDYRRYKRQRKNIERAQKLVGKFGKLGEFIWYTGPYAIRDRILYENAEKRITKTLEEMQKKYIIVYDGKDDEFRIGEKQ